jgi:hypothetical protein
LIICYLNTSLGAELSLAILEMREYVASPALKICKMNPFAYGVGQIGFRRTLDNYWDLHYSVRSFSVP